MILENLEFEQREESQAELGKLAAMLRGDGYEVEVAPLDGSFHAKLEESAEQVFVDVLNIVLEKLEEPALDLTVAAAVSAVRRWARRRKHFRGGEQGKATAVIWGPDGHPLRRVELPEPEEDENQ